MQDHTQPPKNHAKDWRQHLHSLPNGDTSTFPPAFRWLVLLPTLAVAGTLVLFLAGAFLGLSAGIGPEDTGGAIHLLFGVPPVLGLGWLIRFIGARRGCSQRARCASYFAFTASAWAFLLWLGIQYAQHLVSR